MKEVSWDNCPICGAKLYRECWGLDIDNLICWRYYCANFINGGIGKRLCSFGVRFIYRPENDNKPINWEDIL